MKTNNRLLKPHTKYPIDIKHQYILIDGKKYNFKLDYVNMGIDTDGDCIVTGGTPIYVTKYPAGGRLSKKITILNEINKNYNELLKEDEVYSISIYPERYITIKNKRYTYELNTEVLKFDLSNDLIIIRKDLNKYFAHGMTNNDDTPVIDNMEINILKPYKTLTKLNQVRKDVKVGINKSSEIKDLLLVVISKVCNKIINTPAYKSGVLTTQYIMMNGDMLHPRIESIEAKIPTHDDVLYYVYEEKVEHPLGMFELQLYRLMERFIAKVFPRLNQSIMSTKHFIGIPPEWTSDETIKLMETYENYYKEVKKLYKLAGLLSKLRIEKMRGKL